MTQETKIVLGIGVTSLLIILGAIFFLGGSSTPSSTSSSTADPKLLVRNNSNKLGNATAKVTLVEFGDFQCPACGQANPTVKKITDYYKDKILFVFRNFPLPMHQNALVAAESAEAAGKQGKYWEMFEMIYGNQNQWSESNNALDIFISYAQKLQLDTTTFKQDVESNKFADKIKTDQDDGNALGVNATPTFYLNGQQTVGTPNYDELKKDIDQLLKK